MAEPKPNRSLSEKDVKAPNVLERIKEEFEAVLHNEKQGLRADIDANSSISDVKAPNTFERAKEEIEAIVGAIHRNKGSKDSDSQLYGETRESATEDPLGTEKSELHSEKYVKEPNLSVKAKTKSESLWQKPHHHKETHGLSDNIDADTPSNEVKGPNVFERAKEEIEALIHTIHAKKDSEKDVKAPNVIERVKEEFEAVLHNEKQGHHHHKETHGLRADIDVNSSSDVKAPNVLERAKEEIEAIVGAIHRKKESKDSNSQLYGETRESAVEDPLGTEKSELHSGKYVKEPNLSVEAKAKSELLWQKPHHHKETHGLSDNIDADTPAGEVKGPNVFERAKEEIEALIHTIHAKKDSGK